MKNRTGCVSTNNNNNSGPSHIEVEKRHTHTEPWQMPMHSFACSLSSHSSLIPDLLFRTKQFACRAFIRCRLPYTLLNSLASKRACACLLVSLAHLHQSLSLSLSLRSHNFSWRLQPQCHDAPRLCFRARSWQIVARTHV